MNTAGKTLLLFPGALGVAAIMACAHPGPQHPVPGAPTHTPHPGHSEPYILPVQVTADVSCGQVVYHVTAHTPVDLTADDVPADTVPLDGQTWSAPAGQSTHTVVLSAADRPDGPDTVDLYSGPLHDVFVRADTVPWDCPTDSHSTPGAAHSWPTSSSPTGPASPPVGGPTKATPTSYGSHPGHTHPVTPSHTKTPCPTTPPAPSSTATTPTATVGPPTSTSPSVPASTPVTAPVVTVSTTPARTSGGIGVPTSIHSSGLPNTGPSHAQALAGIGAASTLGGLALVGIVWAIGRRRRGEHQ